MAAYSFLTTWVLEAPVDRVYEAIHDTERWPEWWDAVEEARELEPGDDEGRGSVFRLVWKGRLPYRVRFETRVTRVARPWALEGTVTGELVGTGRWRLFEGGGATAAVYEWDVATTRPWMNRAAPVARPVFAWNHDYVMSRGADGLARRLGARLITRT